MPPDRAFRIVSQACADTLATYRQHLLLQEALGVIRDLLVVAMEMIEANTPVTAPTPGKEKIIPMPGIEDDGTEQ
jgi:hypothetical protein